MRWSAVVNGNADVSVVLCRLVITSLMVDFGKINYPTDLLLPVPEPKRRDSAQYTASLAT